MFIVTCPILSPTFVSFISFWLSCYFYAGFLGSPGFLLPGLPCQSFLTPMDFYLGLISTYQNKTKTLLNLSIISFEKMFCPNLKAPALHILIMVLLHCHETAVCSSLHEPSGSFGSGTMSDFGFLVPASGKNFGIQQAHNRCLLK